MFEEAASSVGVRVSTKRDNGKCWQEIYAVRRLMIFAVILIAVTALSNFIGEEHRRSSVAMHRQLDVRNNMARVRRAAIEFKQNRRHVPNNMSELAFALTGSSRRIINPYTEQAELPLFEQTDQNRSRMDIGQVAYFRTERDSFVVVGRSASGYIRLKELDTIPTDE